VISVWPLESDANVMHQDVFYSFLDTLYSSEGILKSGDLYVAADTVEFGINVRIAPGGVIIQYDSMPGGKRLFYNSDESYSCPNAHPNPSFTTDANHWNITSGAVLTRTATVGEFHSSPAGGRINILSAANYEKGITSQAYRVNGRELQELSCWVKAPVGVNVRLSVVEFNAAFVQGVAHGKAVAGTGDWVKIILDPFVTALDCRWLITAVQIQSAGVVSVYVDDFELKPNGEWYQGFQVAHPTLPRIDQVVAMVRDAGIWEGSVLPEADTVSDAKFSVIPGTPTAGATLANLLGMAAVPNNSKRLAHVLVPAGAASLIQANIDTSIAGVTTVLGAQPVGSMTPFVGAAAPAGYLLCDGSAISRTTYAALFAVCGTAYGVGDGSTTFNLPDMRGRMAVGKGTHADVDTLGDSDGDATVGNRRPKHRHTVNETAHAHSYNRPTIPGGPPITGGGIDSYGTASATTGTQLTGITVGPQAASIVDSPAYLTFNWIVRAL
jgi:microcystin-dependent protein